MLLDGPGWSSPGHVQALGKDEKSLSEVNDCSG
jgi:hypothetical protein